MEPKHQTSCIHDENLIRNHEASLATITQSLKDFMIRYETDKRECMERNRSDRQEARDWRMAVDARYEKLSATVNDIKEFIVELRPNYKRALALWGVILLGALAIIWRTIWSHVTSIR